MTKNKLKTILKLILTISFIILLSACSRQRYPRRPKRRRHKNCGCPNFSQNKIINSPTTLKLDHFDVFNV